MADEQKKPSMEVEVSVDAGRSTGATFTPGAEAQPSSAYDDATTLEFNPDGSVTNTSIQRSDDDEEALAALAGEGEEGDAAPEVPAKETEQADLPDFDPANEEVLKAYEDKLFTFDEEGNSSFNMEAVFTEWEANAAKEGAEGGSLNEATYAAISHFTGISKDAIKEIEAGRVALIEKATAGQHAVFGGKEAYDAAFAWAVDGGGYTAEQKAAFNKASDAGGSELQDALELLATRFGKANPNGLPKAPAAPLAPRRPAAPSRSATGRSAAPASPTDSYANSAEYEADVLAKGNRYHPDIRAKLGRSTFYR